MIFLIDIFSSLNLLFTLGFGLFTQEFKVPEPPQSNGLPIRIEKKNSSFLISLFTKTWAEAPLSVTIMAKLSLSRCETHKSQHQAH